MRRKIWNLDKVITIKTLTGHTDSVTSLVVLSDGTLASGSNDNTIKLWDYSTGYLIKTLIGHTRWVTSLVLLSDMHSSNELLASS